MDKDVFVYLNNIANGYYEAELKHRQKLIGSEISRMLKAVDTVKSGKATIDDLVQAGSEIQGFLDKTAEYSRIVTKPVKKQAKKPTTAASKTKTTSKDVYATIDKYQKAHPRMKQVSIDKFVKDTGIKYSMPALCGMLAKYAKNCSYNNKTRMIVFKKNNNSQGAGPGNYLYDAIEKYRTKHPRAKKADISDIAKLAGIKPKQMNLLARHAGAHPGCKYKNGIVRFTKK